MHRIVILPTGDWSEVKGDGSVRFYEMNDAEFYQIQESGGEGTNPATCLATCDELNGYQEV